VDGQGHDHNPLTCYRTAGIFEDFSGRAKLWLDERTIPVQRVSFTGGGGRSYVFTWRYTFAPGDGEGTLNLRRPRGPSSLTIEVVTRAATAPQLDQVGNLLRAVDRQVQTYLPTEAQFENAAKLGR
jgi:hypothetical protein